MSGMTTRSKKRPLSKESTNEDPTKKVHPQTDIVAGQASPSLKELEQSLAQAKKTLAAEKKRVEELKKAITFHPEKVATAKSAVQEQVKKIMTDLKAEVEKQGYVNCDNVFQEIENGFETTPTLVNFPVHFPTKYYMPDADGEVTACCYLWNGKPAFLWNAELFGVHSGHENEFGMNFTCKKDMFQSDSIKRMPTRFRKFLPEEDAPESYGLCGLEEKDLAIALSDLNEYSFLELVAASKGNNFEGCDILEILKHIAQNDEGEYSEEEESEEE